MWKDLYNIAIHIYIGIADSTDCNTIYLHSIIL